MSVTNAELRKEAIELSEMTQPIDDDERTSSMGLFNSADAFRLAARALGSVGLEHGHADMPRRYLYYHPLELS